MSDEVHFQLNGVVNKENCWVWADHQRQLHLLASGVSPERIFGSYFFENEDCIAVLINCAQYRMMLEFF